LNKFEEKHAFTKLTFIFFLYSSLYCVLTVPKIAKYKRDVWRVLWCIAKLIIHGVCYH